MAEDNAKGDVPAAVRQLLQERAREGVALPAPAAPAEVAQPESLAPSTKDDLSLPELKEAFEKRLYGLLLEPNVMANLRRLFCSRKDPKGTRELFAILAHTVRPPERHTGSGPAKVVFVSKIERPGANTTAVRIETPS